MKGTQIHPLHSYVLIKPLEAETTTPSGIVLPETAKEKPQMGAVMAVGPGSDCCDDGACCGGGCGEGCCADEQSGKAVKTNIVKKGDKVLYKKWAGNEIKVGHEEWLLVEVKDIMAIVE